MGTWTEEGETRDSLTINPGAAEACNGVDDNCDGQTDEGVKNSYYPDADGDGYGAAGSSPVHRRRTSRVYA